MRSRSITQGTTKRNVRNRFLETHCTKRVIVLPRIRQHSTRHQHTAGNKSPYHSLGQTNRNFSRITSKSNHIERKDKMASLDNVLQQLRQEHKQAQIQVEKLKEVISAIEGLGTTSSGTSVIGSRPRRIVSASSRRRMAQAQKARWAKAGKGPQPVSKASGTVPKRIMSTAARRKIAAAQRARWAKVRAAEKKAA